MKFTVGKPPTEQRTQMGAAGRVLGARGRCLHGPAHQQNRSRTCSPSAAQVPPTEPPEFGELVARCLHREHACRPPFAEIEAALRGMRAAPAAKDCPA
jgi:hypothetical protein